MLVSPPSITQTTLLFVRIALLVLQIVPGGLQLLVTSWYRSPLQNAEAGGVANSLHQLGLALDLVGDLGVLSEVAAVWRALGLDAVLEPDHLHIELDGPGLR